MAEDILISLENVTVGYDESIIQENLNFGVKRGTVTILMGPSGCGKSTVVRAMIGLLPVKEGKVIWFGRPLEEWEGEREAGLNQRFGMLFQKGALWTSLSLAENVELPLRFFTAQSEGERRSTAEERLSRVGLLDAKDKLPAEISGGMQKRAGLARAMALDPEVLLLDEPSAGLDPISSRSLDDLIIKLKNENKKTFVIVTHELDSIFAVGDDSIFLDNETKTAIAAGNPKQLRDNPPSPKVGAFLRREGIVADAR